MSIEAMKQALEALETYHGYMEPLTTVFGGPRVPAEQSATGKVERSITTLRAAIEQAEKQEPTEDMVLALRGASELGTEYDIDALRDVLAVMPLYTAPQPQEKTK